MVRIKSGRGEFVNSLNNEANKCFVCGPGNSSGLNIRFRLEGEVCRAEYTPIDQYVGYDGVVHGGILFALLDDVMANWLYLRGEVCFTAKAEIRYRRPVLVGETLSLEGRLLERRGRRVVLEGRGIRLQDHQTLIEATGTFIVQN